MHSRPERVRAWAWKLALAASVLGGVVLYAYHGPRPRPAQGDAPPGGAVEAGKDKTSASLL